MPTELPEIYPGIPKEEFINILKKLRENGSQKDAAYVIPWIIFYKKMFITQQELEKKTGKQVVFSFTETGVNYFTLDDE